tara:strand:+ start:2211 stop:2876 length:666 start_codon:yes stop_codon:yes gene_type:complete
MTVKNEVTLLALITSAAEADNTVRRASDQLVDVINTTARLIRKDPATVKLAEECGLHPCDLFFSPYTNGKSEALKPERTKGHAAYYNVTRRAAFDGMSKERQGHVKRGDAMTAKERTELFTKEEQKQYKNWRGQANNFLGRLGNAVAKLDGVTPIHKQESEKAREIPLNQQLWESLESTRSQIAAMVMMDSDDTGMALAALIKALDAAKIATNYVKPAEVK